MMNFLFSNNYVLASSCVCAMRLTQNQNESIIPKVWSLSKKIMDYPKNWVLSSRFWSVMLRLNLIMMDANWRYYALTQGIRTIKTFIKYKKCAAANKFTAKFKKQCQILQLFRQKRNIISQTNHKYLASTTHISHTLKFLL